MYEGEIAKDTLAHMSCAGIEDVKKFYSGGQAIADMSLYTARGLKIWEREIAETWPVGARVLDIGCGMGREAFCLHELGFAIVGVDISEPAVYSARQLAVERGIAIEFITYDGLNLPFADASFDVAIIWAQTFGLFHTDEHKRHMLTECARVLRCGGSLSFSGHDRAHLRQHFAQYLIADRFFPYTDTDCYWDTFEPDDLACRAKEAGFPGVTCARGLVYAPEDGLVLCCAGSKG